MRLAAIDIGSNSIKLVVVEASAADSFAVLARERDVARLGHDTLREGYLAPAAVERAAETIRRVAADLRRAVARVIEADEAADATSEKPVAPAPAAD